MRRAPWIDLAVRPGFEGPELTERLKVVVEQVEPLEEPLVPELLVAVVGQRRDPLGCGYRGLDERRARAEERRAQVVRRLVYVPADVALAALHWGRAPFSMSASSSSTETRSR